MSIPITKQLLLSGNYWVLNKDIVNVFGLEPAFLLSSFAEAEQIMADADGWFYQTTETVEDITTLSRHKQDQAIKTLEDIGVLEKQVRGMPAKRYFRINYNRVANLIVKNQQTGMSEINEQDCQKSATNKESIYKESSNKESSTNSTRTTEINTDLFLNKWNELGGNIPSIKFIRKDSTRYRHLKARVEEYGEDTVLEMIDKVSESDFLKGNATDWTATFDWAINASNFLKIIEGNYDNKQPRSQAQRKEDEFVDMLNRFASRDDEVEE